MFPVEDDNMYLEDDSTRRDTVMIEVNRKAALEILYALAEELNIEIP